MMKYRKAIAYAYATSTHARTLGVTKTGGFFVQHQVMREDGTWSPPFIATGTEGDVFQAVLDPDLQSLFEEVEGDICEESLRYHPEYYPRPANARLIAVAPKSLITPAATSPATM